MRRAVSVVVIVLSVMVLAVCCEGAGAGTTPEEQTDEGSQDDSGTEPGGDDTGTGGDDTNDPSDTDTGPVVPQAGEVGVFFRVYLGSSSDYMHEYGITLENDSYAIFRYLPARNSVALVYDYTDPSWADPSYWPYTESGELYVVDGNDSYYDDATSWYFLQFDPVTCEQQTYGTSFYANVRYYTKINSQVFYLTNRTSDPFNGYTGGDLKRYDATTGQVQTLQSYGAQENHYDVSQGLFTRDGKFYSVSMGYTGAGDYVFQVYERSMTTGAVADVVLHVDIGEESLYEHWYFAINDYAIFWSRQVIASDLIQLWRAGWGESNPTHIASFSNHGGYTTGLDVSGRSILLPLAASDTGNIYIYDEEQDTKTLYDLGTNMRFEQILEY